MRNYRRVIQGYECLSSHTGRELRLWVSRRRLQEVELQ